MATEHEATVAVRPDGRPEVRLLPVWARPLCRDRVTGEVMPNIVDQGQVRVAARRVEGH